MYQIREIINGRRIFYLNAFEETAMFAKAELKNWALLVLVNDASNPMLSQFAEVCLDKDVIYVCAAGSAASKVDDLFDTAIVVREIGGKRLPSWYKSVADCLMTAWHEDSKEGLWFMAKVANYEGQVIDKVIVADFTGEYAMDAIEIMAADIERGWTPSD